MEGDSVTLNSDLTQIQSDDEMMWKYDNILIAKIYGKDNKSRVYNESADGRFRDRLELDQTGSLIITNTRTTDSGLYTASSKNSGTVLFRLTVYARLSTPVISRDPSVFRTYQHCSLLCSVVNVGHVTLSWYKGNSLLSSINVSDLSISLSLTLEVEHQEKNNYSCVVNNPVSNQTTQLNITQLCHINLDFIHCCGSTEAVIRLALSALVGVAAVAVLVYEFRSRNLRAKERADVAIKQELN
ncbi:CD48 antigen-like [Puntigrus tetrazona]|uniref:CD48 antigen-like n=1 Tax=Puntigrus tetrazona TaxID=1606681 RepID=UPI001C8AB2FF|nr:CD48 antigen-like [Puntigrus tetrazona]